MKRILIILALAACLLVGASPRPSDLVRLTLVNKAGVAVAVQLNSADDQDYAYYLKLPAGTPDQPVEKVFTIAAGQYTIKTYYIQIYDPVYGYACPTPPATNLDASGDLRLTFTKCGVRPPAPGEPSMMKYWRWRAGELE